MSLSGYREVLGEWRPCIHTPLLQEDRGDHMFVGHHVRSVHRAIVGTTSPAGCLHPNRGPPPGSSRVSGRYTNTSSLRQFIKVSEQKEIPSVIGVEAGRVRL